MPVHGPPLNCVNVLPCNARLIASDLRTFPCNFLSKINLSVNRAAVQCPLLALSGHRLVHCKCPLSGVKRTWRLRCEMSAYDPKRTSVTPLLLQINLLGFQRTSVVLDLRRMASAPTRFHQSYCWLGSRVAARGARAAAGDARGW